MPRKRHTAEEIAAKLRQLEGRTRQGTPVADAVRAIGVTEATYYPLAAGVRLATRTMLK